MGNESGQSMIEVIVVASVSILIVMALTFATLFSLRNSGFAKSSAQATKLAQEGIERVRTGRDRNALITGNFQISGNNITSWNGDASGNGAIWSYQINGNCGNTAVTPPTYCYFNISTSGSLQYLTAALSLPSGVELIGQFKRVAILSDVPATYLNQKTLTVIVKWNDVTGEHESKQTTILRKI